ncbi:16S rRNA processing protein RimM [Methylomarinovum tepidoasis]|uniref:Ribosome maturation factor RimM n=1 Tax=Methylomarinovum tepidoasis TaxID=2840183 RepID=A0AAU9CB01_9GAMM|nr:ribosome maturation factor RimM [Methylomarinovum sp. IN45]BCX87826.1 16S rRNA processing protein RimM [Methylomarinovum sp. IN45]
MRTATDREILLGEISGVFGVRGWVKVYSHTQPRENILSYSPWRLRYRGETRQVRPLEGRRQGKTVVARLEGVESREQAEALRGAGIFVARSQLPPLPAGEYYWHDLIGLEVRDVEGRVLGRVIRLMETGANDVLVLEGPEGREILVPWIRDRVIRRVDLEAGVIEADWDPDY